MVFSHVTDVHLILSLFLTAPFLLFPVDITGVDLLLLCSEKDGNLVHQSQTGRQTEEDRFESTGNNAKNDTALSNITYCPPHAHSKRFIQRGCLLMAVPVNYLPTEMQENLIEENKNSEIKLFFSLRKSMCFWLK